MPFAYLQDLNPLGHRLASTVVAALPVLVLFYLLVGRRWVASAAGAAGAAVAILIAATVYGMPADMAGMAFVHGAFFGLLPIGWTVFAAMLLYNLTVETGQFSVIRRSIGRLSGDARVQVVLVGFCFGAFLEGSAGSGAPVAVCGAMLVGLGVPAFRAAVLCLIANTSPVAYGGLGMPLIVLGNVTGINSDTLSVMAGHQLPIMSCFIPLYMVKCVCSWRQTVEIWPVLLVSGGSFAVFQYLFAVFHTFPGMPAVWPITDVGGGIFSLITLALFLRFVWRPKVEWRFPEAAGVAPIPATDGPQLTTWLVAKAWSPFAVMSLCLVATGLFGRYEKARADAKLPPLQVGFLKSTYELDVPTLHKEVQRAARLAKPGATDESRKEPAVMKFIWLTAPGTPVFVACVLSALLLRARWRSCVAVLRRTLIQMKVPIPTIMCMLGLSYVTKYAGIDATLGVAFAETGILYPFFAAFLGWLGVFLTGTDAGSNALFGSLQQITAGEVFKTGVLTELTLDQAEVLICTANSTGGVMGKMIDAQSICVATAGTNQLGKEADIFKAVVGHSVFLAAVVGLLVTLQAYAYPFTLMVPRP